MKALLGTWPRKLGLNISAMFFNFSVNFVNRMHNLLFSGICTVIIIRKKSKSVHTVSRRNSLFKFLNFDLLFYNFFLLLLKDKCTDVWPIACVLNTASFLEAAYSYLPAQLSLGIQYCIVRFLEEEEQILTLRM